MLLHKAVSYLLATRLTIPSRLAIWYCLYSALNGLWAFSSRIGSQIKPFSCYSYICTIHQMITSFFGVIWKKNWHLHTQCCRFRSQAIPRKLYKTVQVFRFIILRFGCYCERVLEHPRGVAPLRHALVTGFSEAVPLLVRERLTERETDADVLEPTLGRPEQSLAVVPRCPLPVINPITFI